MHKRRPTGKEEQKKYFEEKRRNARLTRLRKESEEKSDIKYLKGIIQSMMQMVVVENEEEGDFMQEVESIFL